MKSFLLLIFICLTFTANAGNRGIQWGAGLSTFTGDINDPDGATNVSDLFLSFSGVSVIESGRDNRWFSLINFGSYDVDPTTELIGQSNDYYYVGTSYQTNFRWSRNVKPWFGIGLGLGYESFTGRHTVDVDGFLNQSFVDRDEFGALLMLDASHDFEVFKQNFVIRVSYMAALYDGSNLTEFSIFWLFN